VWLPWTLGLVGRPWTARARGDAAGDPGPTERDGEGRAYLWCVLATGLIVLSAISIKLEIYLLPLVPPLAVLTADTLARAPEKARRRIWLAVTLGLIAVAAAVAALPWFVQEPALTGIALASAVLLAAVAAGVFLLRRGGVEPALAALVLGLAGTVNATLAFGGPALDALLSPRAGAEVIREYAAQGYLPIAHATFPGVYSYYVGARVRETRRFETLATVMRRHPRVVIAMRQRDWDRWTARPDGLTIVHRQRLAGTETLVVVSSR
jgi:4-amino-4-deoxy-L-arabinose transferase-like glycosyltransferase